MSGSFKRPLASRGISLTRHFVEASRYGVEAASDTRVSVVVMKFACLILAVLAACNRIPARPQTPHPRRTLAGIEVKIEPEGLVAWVVSAKNLRDSPVRLLWDESTFVDTDGRSYGRLLRGRTKVIDETKPQLATHIIPDAYIVEWCVPEFLLGARVVTTKEGGRNYSAMDPVRKGVGRMVLVFETAAGREVWETSLSFDGTAPPPLKPERALMPTSSLPPSISPAAPTQDSVDDARAAE